MITQTMIELAQKEGQNFREQHGREPTPVEAERIAAMIMRQARIAHAMLKRNGAR